MKKVPLMIPCCNKRYYVCESKSFGFRTLEVGNEDLLPELKKKYPDLKFVVTPENQNTRKIMRELYIEKMMRLR